MAMCAGTGFILLFGVTYKNNKYLLAWGIITFVDVVISTVVSIILAVGFFNDAAPARDPDYEVFGIAIVVSLFFNYCIWGLSFYLVNKLSKTPPPPKFDDEGAQILKQISQ